MGLSMGVKTWFVLLEKSSNGVFKRIGVGKQEIGCGLRCFDPKDWPTLGPLFENAEEETIDIE